MKPKNQAFFRIVVGIFVMAILIDFVFNNKYASSFLFGAGFCSLLYELNGMVRNRPKKK